MAHDSRTGCSGRLACSDRSGLASGSGRLAFWARLALVVLLGLLAGLGLAWVSARRPEWRPVAVFALVGSAGLVLLVRRYWPQWLWRYAGFVLLGLGWLTARRWGVPLGWEVFLALAMLYGLGLGVWDAVRERRGCGVGCLPDGCSADCNAFRTAELSTSPDNRNASVAELAEAKHRLRVSRRRLELLRPLSEESNRITDEILRLYKLSDEEVLREVGLPRASLATIRELRKKLFDLQTEAQLLAIANQRVRFWTQKADAAEAELTKWRSGALKLATWDGKPIKLHTDDEHRKADRGTENGQRQVAGQVGSASEGEPRDVHIEMPKLDYSEAELLRLAKALTSYRPRELSQTELQNAAAKAGISLESAEQFVREWEATWPAIRRPKPPVPHSDEDPSELDATAGPNVSSQLDLPFDTLGGRPLVQHADPVAAYEQSRGIGRELWATPEAQEYIASLRGGRSSEPVEPTATQQCQQIQAALRQGDQDIAANRGHDLGEVLADLDGKPSLAQPAPKPTT